MFYYSTVSIQIYFGQSIYCFYDSDDELDDNKYLKFIYIEIQCNMQFFYFEYFNVYFWNNWFHYFFSKLDFN